MLPVVDGFAVEFDAPGATAQRAGRLIQGDLLAGLRQADGGSATGPAAADDGNPFL